ncbi:3D domain-containing protein [Aneurinibacillus sp. REN35]|uniref:3D domain-containing protein n=1 Tax=Aneurinibacillus sp. REN35 TaxID=3237286 RepID=UPI003527774A
MRKSRSISLFRSIKAFRDNRKLLVIKGSMIMLLLCMYPVSSLAETPQQPVSGTLKNPPILTQSIHQALPYSSGEVSAKELEFPTALPAQDHTIDSVKIAAVNRNTNNRTLTRPKKPARSTTMTKVREGMTFTAHASGYTGPGRTKSGTKVRPGIVAVDTDYIPLGTVLYVEGYGQCRAEDIGGAIKGNAIDLAFATKKEALAWGRRDVEVKVISVP